MTITSWSPEECRKLALSGFHEHVARLDEWIGTLSQQAQQALAPATEAASAILKPIMMPRLISLIARLSEKKVQALLQLARQAIVFDQILEKHAQQPCARHEVPEAKSTAEEASQAEANGVVAMTYEEAKERLDQRRAAAQTPVRAAAEQNDESLPKPLAREANAVFASLSAPPAKGSVREQRRQRKKDLRRALKKR